jgi:hypothetical protein
MEMEWSCTYHCKIVQSNMNEEEVSGEMNLQSTGNDSRRLNMESLVVRIGPHNVKTQFEVQLQFLIIAVMMVML